MPCVRLGKFGVLTFAGAYQPGDQPPAGFIDWQEWATVQNKAGLRQAKCGRCGKWHFPQELSALRDINEVNTRKDGSGRMVRYQTLVCNRCAARSTAPAQPISGADAGGQP